MAVTAERNVFQFVRVRAAQLGSAAIGEILDNHLTVVRRGVARNIRVAIDLILFGDVEVRCAAGGVEHHVMRGLQAAGECEALGNAAVRG